jgi:hypothetical protein
MRKAERDPRLNNAKDCSTEPNTENDRVSARSKAFASTWGLIPSESLPLKIAVHHDTCRLHKCSLAQLVLEVGLTGWIAY